MKFRFSARVDLLTDNTLWELKCTSQLGMDHKLQVIIYAWLWRVLFDETMVKKEIKLLVEIEDFLSIQNTVNPRLCLPSSGCPIIVGPLYLCNNFILRYRSMKNCPKFNCPEEVSIQSQKYFKKVIENN